MESQKIAKVRKKFLKRMKANGSLEAARIHPNDVVRVKTQDCWLQRFLEHNEFDISAAVEMLWWTCEWRKKFGVNEVHETNVNREYLEDGSCFSYGKDRDGKALFIVTYKMHRKAVRNTTDMQRCLVYWLERLERQSNGDKISLLLDMSGAGLPNIDMDLTKLLINACTVFYPNFINYILVLEASFLLFPTLKIIKDWLPESVLPRFKQIKKSGLKEFVDPAVALKSWGGTNSYVFRFIPENFHPTRTDDTNKDDFAANLKSGSLKDGKSSKNQVNYVSKNREILGENGNNDTSPPAKRQKLNHSGNKSPERLKSKNQSILHNSIDESALPCRNFSDKSSESCLESPEITIVDEFEVVMKQERPESPIEALELPQWTRETPQAVKSSRKSAKGSIKVVERAKTPESTSTDVIEHQKRIKKPSWKVLEALKDAETSRMMKKAEKKVRKELKNTEKTSRKDMQASKIKLGKTVEILDDRTAPEKPATDSLEFADASEEISCNRSNPPVETLTLNYTACIQGRRGRKKNPDGPRLIVESPESKAERIVASLKEENNDDSPKTKKRDKILSLEQILKLAKMEIELLHEVPPQHQIETYAGTIALTKEQRKQFRGYANLKNGPFSEEEDEIIHDNWQKFCEIHHWDKKVRYPFVQIKHKGFYYLQSIKNRVKFVQFLAQGLPNRTLYSVYHRFRNLWSTYKEGRYTLEEDAYIIKLMAGSEANDASGSNRRDKKYSIASKKLNRTRQSVWRRWMLLKKETEYDRRPQLCYST